MKKNRKYEKSVRKVVSNMNNNLEQFIIELINKENFIEEVKLITPNIFYKIFYLDSFILNLFIKKCKKYNIRFFEENVATNLFKQMINDEKIFKNYDDLIPLLNVSNQCIIDLSKMDLYYFSYLKDKSVLVKLFYELSNLKLDTYDVLTYMTDEQLETIFNNSQVQQRYKIFRHFKNDETREKYLYKLALSDMENAIKLFENDEIKIKKIPFLFKNKSNIICTLKNDQLKEQWIIKHHFFLTKQDKIKIIASFENFEYLKKYLYLIKSDSDKLCLLENMKEDLIKSNPTFYDDIFLSIKSEKYTYLALANCSTNLEVQKKCIEKISNQEYLIKLFEIDLNKDYILPKMSTNTINKLLKKCIYYIENDDGYKLLYYVKDEKLILKIIEHVEINCNYDDRFLYIFQTVSSYYKLNLNHLIMLAKITNCNILNLVTNENISKVINYDEESFQKYIKMFDSNNTNLDISTLANIDTCFLQVKFSIENSDLINIFINTLHDLNDNNIKDAIKKIHQVCRVIDLKKYKISKQDLIHGIYSGNKSIIKLYNDITKEYLKIKRNEYVNNNLEECLSNTCRATYNKNSFLKYFIKIIPLDLFLDVVSNYSIKESKEKIELLENKELLTKIFLFKKNPKNYNITPDMKKNLKIFDDLFFEIYFDMYDNIKIPEGKLEFQINKNVNSNLIDIMADLDSEKLKNIIFADEELYENLLNYLKKYKLLGWNGCFDKVAMDADIDLCTSVICSLISNFNIILDKKKQSQDKGEYFGFNSELSLAEALDSDASIYLYLMGYDIYRLFKSNPGPNKSPMKKNERFNEFIVLLKELLKRDKISVPPMDEDVVLSNSKKINISIGDCKNIINFVLGEKTGACMRIGGAGYSLFKFCLLDENGFHITFNDPTTGELISRVSCFRNGNTVFLNQLRYSLSSKYDNQDIIKACQMAGKMLIEATKNSEYPIENVVSSPCYAYENSKTVLVNINPTLGLSKFYTDIENDLVVVATNQDGEMAPFKLGPNKVCKYSLKRVKIKKYVNKKAFVAINQIHTLEKFKNNILIDDMNIPNKFDVLVAYVGEDWYVALLPDGQIVNYVQKNSPKEAFNEMNIYLSVIKKQISDIEIINEYGGDKYERDWVGKKL